jgi:hypothetical protein
MIRTRFIFVAMLVAASAACSSSNEGGAADASASTAQKLAVGSACTQDSDCGSAPFFCMTEHPGGYCMRKCDIAKADADCPSEAICQFDGTVGECHKKCSAAGDCRSGYTCSPASMGTAMKASHAFCDMGDMTDGGTDMDGMSGMDAKSGMPGMDM